MHSREDMFQIFGDVIWNLLGIIIVLCLFFTIFIGIMDNFNTNIEENTTNLEYFKAELISKINLCTDKCKL